MIERVSLVEAEEIAKAAAFQATAGMQAFKDAC